MAQALNLPPLHVHAIRVPVRKIATSIGDPDELFLQLGENGGVQVDAFWRDAMGNEIHDSKEFNEDEYETIRKRYLITEQATLPPFSSFKSGNTVGRVVGETAPAGGHWPGVWQSQPAALRTAQTQDPHDDQTLSPQGRWFR